MMSPHSELIEFLPVTEKKLRKLLDEVSEGAAWPRRPTISSDTLDALAVAARGDLRKCLSTLEIALRGGTTDPAATHKSDAGVSDVHAVRRICRGGSAKRDSHGRWVDSNGHEVDGVEHARVVEPPRASSVARHAIDATPARWRGDAGSSLLDRARRCVVPTNELSGAPDTLVDLPTGGPRRDGVQFQDGPRRLRDLRAI